MTQLVHSASMLVIGDELLTGKVSEANAQPLAQTLRQLGIVLNRVSIVGDDEAEIVSELNRLRDSTDIVITSGGVGPTHDDITLEAIAKAFGVAALEHPLLAEMLRKQYKQKLTDAHLRMALTPAGAELITTSEIRWPTVKMQNVWIFPGIPELFRMKLVILREHLRGPLKFVTRAAFVYVDEPELKPLLDEVVTGSPLVQVGSYPKFMDSRYRTKVTFDGQSEDSVEQALNAFCQRLSPDDLAWTE